MEKKITNIRRNILRQAFMNAVLDKGDKGIHYDDVIKTMEKTVEFTDRELSLNPSGAVRWKVFLPFGIIPPVKFGWLKRDKGIFWMTEKGKAALSMDPAAMSDEIKKLWHEWKLTNSDGDDASEDDNEVEAPVAQASDPEFFLETPAHLNNERTVFKRVDYDLAGLLHYIDIGDIGLPDIQRPFVWTAAKVRDLFDSMYRGFPVGYLLFWSNAGAEGSIVVSKVKEMKQDEGFNAATEVYEDLVKAGVIDPAKVVRSALQNASSIASLLLTTEALVSEIPEEKKDGGGGGHGHGGGGGMGGMY